MNNLLSYCGLVDARKSASEKDLHVRDEDSLADPLAILLKQKKQHKQTDKQTKINK